MPKKKDHFLGSKKYKSSALKSLHFVAQDLHAVGAIDDKAMTRFDESCIKKN